MPSPQGKSLLSLVMFLQSEIALFKTAFHETVIKDFRILSSEHFKYWNNKSRVYLSFDNKSFVISLVY